MIEVIYRKEHYSPVPISWFMVEAIEGLTGIFESMLAHLCNKHVLHMGGMPTQVVELPPERRGKDNKHVRYSYGVQFNGQIVPAG